jgi:hypothetical protein
MDKLLDYYTVKADRDSGFWIGLPAATGQSVRRSDWLSLMDDDPDHFQLAALTAAELTGCPTEDDEAFVEQAVFVTWSDEMLH